MRKFLVLLLVLMVSLASFASAPISERRALSSTGRLFLTDARNRHGSCSCFAIKNTRFVVTAAHCADDTVSIRLQFARSVKEDTEKRTDGVELTKVIYNAKDDIAILAAPRVFTVGYRLAEREPLFGEPVWALGFPAAGEFTLNLTAGIKGGYAYDGDTLFQKLDLNIAPGSSGGPIIDGSGRIIGLASSVSTPEFGGFMAFSPRLAAIRKALTEAGKK